MTGKSKINYSTIIIFFIISQSNKNLDIYYTFYISYLIGIQYFTII